jgi:hypothetical protein
MKPDRIYIDNSLLVRWFLHLLYPDRYADMPQIIKFLTEEKEMQKFISLISVAELIHTLKYGKDFAGKNLSMGAIMAMIDDLQNIMGFKVILRDKVGETQLNGVIVSTDILEFLDKHNHIIDCIHVDIAKHHDLFFVTYEGKIGRMREFYDKIMTEKKLLKQ